MNSDQEIEALPRTLKTMLRAPFPQQAAAPNDDFSRDSWQTFFADAPDRLIHLVAGGYHDHEDDDPVNRTHAFDDLWSASDERHQAIYRRCAGLLTEALGPGRVLSKNDLDAIYLRLGKPDHPGFEQSTPPVLLNPEAINFSTWRFEITWWQVDGRLVLLHHVGDQGDGDFQFAVSLCVLPDGPAGHP